MTGQSRKSGPHGYRDQPLTNELFEGTERPNIERLGKL